uniref:Uncharacterized protein n=1 Tax=Globodera rostochiensis TaxID=31243 RepID=A0A914GY04_GLORO
MGRYSDRFGLVDIRTDFIRTDFGLVGIRFGSHGEMKFNGETEMRKKRESSRRTARQKRVYNVHNCCKAKVSNRIAGMRLATAQEWRQILWLDSGSAIGHAMCSVFSGTSAAGIDITQTAHNGQKEDNNLALRTFTGEFLLNGQYQVSVFRQQIPI